MRRSYTGSNPAFKLGPRWRRKRIKKFVLYLTMFIVTFAVIVLFGEVALRLFRPIEYLSPRYKYSPKYGFLLFEDTEMVHAVPGQYKFHYTVNNYGYRGQPVELRAEYATPNIIILGDSYTFGMGVNDGEEYPALLGEHLQSDYNVVNLGNPGWGLTQEIRRYYDFGSLFKPKIVVLQFCSNDPEDNFNNRVTRIENGEFKFVNSAGGINWTKRYLSRSFLQKSQLYNFFRGPAYNFLKNLRVKKQEAEYEASDQNSTSRREDYYNELLGKFANELHRENVRLVVIAVNDQLDRYPEIKKHVLGLDQRGLLQYVEVARLFDHIEGFGSPEGHVWGAPAHRIVAKALSDSIRNSR